METLHYAALGEGNATTDVTFSRAAVAGEVLVVFSVGSVTMTTPTGWTLEASYVNASGMYIWTKTAVGGETGFSTTKNASWNTFHAVYAFPAGSLVTNHVGIWGNFWADGTQLFENTRDTAGGWGTTAPCRVLALPVSDGAAAKTMRMNLDSSFGWLEENLQYTAIPDPPGLASDYAKMCIVDNVDEGETYGAYFSLDGGPGDACVMYLAIEEANVGVDSSPLLDFDLSQYGANSATDFQPISLGTRFAVNAPGTIQRLWWYKHTASDPGVQTMFVLNRSNNTVLGTKTVDFGTETGWVFADLDTPVAVDKDVAYTVGISMGASDNFTTVSNFFNPRVEGSVFMRWGEYVYTATQAPLTGWTRQDDGWYYGLSFDFVAASPSSFSIYDIAWTAGFNADDYAGTYNDGDVLSADPTGFNGYTFVRSGTPTFRDSIDDIASLSAIEFPADAPAASRLAVDPSWSDTSVLTAVIVGRVLNATGGDLMDGASANRRLLDTDGNFWRTYAGSSVVSGGTADTDLHLFVMEFQQSGVETLWVDNVQTLSGEAGGATNAGLYVGSSDNGEHNGSRVSFVGFIDRELTAQERDDIWGWYQEVSAGFSFPTEIVVRGRAAGEIDISWTAPNDAEGVRLYVDGVENNSAGLLTGSSYVLTGLVDGQAYDIQLLSEKDSGATQSSLSPTISERASRVVSSVSADLYQGYNQTPLVDTPIGSGNQRAVSFGPHSAFSSNARNGNAHFEWFEAGTTTPVYGYAHEWLDGATIIKRSGGTIRIVEWILGTDTWRETDLVNDGDSHTIDYSNLAMNAGGGGTAAGPLNNTLLEHAASGQDNFEAWIVGATEPVEPAAPPTPNVAVTWRSLESSSSDGTSYTFSNVDIGTDTNLLAVAMLRGLSDLTGSSITIDGVPITPVSVRPVQDVGGGAYNWVAVLNASDLTGPVEIVVTAASSALRCAVAVWSADQLPSEFTGGVVIGNEHPAFVTDAGALLSAAYVNGSYDFVRANSTWVERASVDVEPTNNVVLVADDLADSGLTYVRTTVDPPQSYMWTAYLTFALNIPENDVVVENAKTGVASGVGFTPVGAANGDVGYLGYAKQYSVNAGETIDFAIDGLSASQVAIYRIGHYGGDGKRLITTLSNTPTAQSGGTTIVDSNGATEVSAWANTASWAVPSDTVSGLFVAAVRDGSGDARSWIPFVVRNDARDADIVFMTSDSTWAAAYNFFGDQGTEKTGKSVYGAGGALGNIQERAHAVSYDRPIVTRGSIVNHWDNLELPLLDWLEENGYNVKYIGSYDLDQQNVNDVLGNASILLSNGHDEYWSPGMRDNTEAFRDAGGNVIFMAGNHVFWKIRWADGGRTFWCYKDTMPGPGAHVAGQPLDPVEWTGTWKDTRWANREPEYLLTGDNFRMNGINDLPMTVDAATYGSLPFWRNTSVQDGPTDLTNVPEIIGFEANAYHPPDSGAIRLAQTTHNIDGSFADNNGQGYAGAGDLDWSPVMFLATPTSGVTVSFGTNQWAWGLSNRHDRGAGTSERVQIRQATMNLLADLGALPETTQVDLVTPTPVAISTYGVTHTGVNPYQSEGQTGSIWYPSDISAEVVAAADPVSYSLATRFTVALSGTIQRLWYYKVSAQDIVDTTFYLVDFTNELVLGQAIQNWGVETGWVYVDLPTPVAVENDGTIYGVCLAVPPSFDYTYGADMFASGPFTNHPITALGGSYALTDQVTATGYTPGAAYGMDVELVLPVSLGTKVGAVDVAALKVGSVDVVRAYRGAVRVFGSAL